MARQSAATKAGYNGGRIEVGAAVVEREAPSGLDARGELHVVSLVGGMDADLPDCQQQRYSHDQTGHERRDEQATGSTSHDISANAAIPTNRFTVGSGRPGGHRWRRP